MAEGREVPNPRGLSQDALCFVQSLADLLGGVSRGAGVRQAPVVSTPPTDARFIITEWLDDVDQDNAKITAREAECEFLDLLLDRGGETILIEELIRLRILHLALAAKYGFGTALDIFRAHQQCPLADDQLRS